MTKDLAQLEKILKGYESLTSGMATNKEVGAVVNSILKSIKDLTDKLDAHKATNKGEIDNLYTNTLEELKLAEDRLKTEISKLSDSTDQTITQVLKRIDTEVNIVKSLIPQLPDLSPLESRITNLENKPDQDIPEVTPIQVRDKLETLDGNERLDISAIKGFDQTLEDLKKTKGNIRVVGGRKDVWHNGTGKTMNSLTVSATAPSNPFIGDLWVDTA